MQVSFSRHRYELPLLGAFFVIALVELFAVHLLVSLWSSLAAWLLSGATILMLGQIALLVHGMISWPTLVNDKGIIVRYGKRREIFVPFSQIVSVEDVAFRPEEKGPETFRATLLAQPNIAIRLSEPLPLGRRAPSTISMRLDDSRSFLELVDGRLGADGSRSNSAQSSS